jgi:hypothetical protein
MSGKVISDHTSETTILRYRQESEREERGTMEKQASSKKDAPPTKIPCARSEVLIELILSDGPTNQQRRERERDK